MRAVFRLSLLITFFALSACQTTVKASYSGAPNQHDNMIAELEKFGMQVVQQGNRVAVIIPSINFFSPQKNMLFENKGHDLLALAAFVKTYRHSTVRVIGFSDDIGTPTDQYYRARNQAEVVAAFLWRGGVPLAQTTTQILGSSTIGKVAADTTPTGRTANQRVEVWVN